MRRTTFSLFFFAVVLFLAVSCLAKRAPVVIDDEEEETAQPTVQQPTAKLTMKCVLQSSFDNAVWSTRGIVKIGGGKPTTTSQLAPSRRRKASSALDIVKFDPFTAKVTTRLSPAEVDALIAAENIYYRLVAEENVENEDNPRVVASMIVSPCALIRRFDAVSSEMLLLDEPIAVAVLVPSAEFEDVDDATPSVVGLQWSTGLHDSAQVCDRSILSLFASVQIETTVASLQPSSLILTPDFNEPTPTSAAAEVAMKAMGKSKSDKAGEKKEEEKSFWDKYWLYIIGAGVFLVFQTLTAPAAAPEGGQQGGGGGQQK